MMRIEIMTTLVEVSTSSREGQFTFLSSALDSLRKLIIFFKLYSFIHLINLQARQDSNPQHPVLETGALPIRATGLRYRGSIIQENLKLIARIYYN